MTTVSRRQGRETAFLFLYGYLPNTVEIEARFVKVDFIGFCESFERAIDEFAWEEVAGVGQNLPTIDKAISQLSTNWRIERMPRVDLTLLRLCGYEILFRPDIPKTVSINEAVELAKRFGAEDSPAFVNGILDKLDKPAQ